jgi:allantoinase
MRASRRGFLKGLGATGAALGANGLLPPPAAAQERGTRSLKISELAREHYHARRKAIEWPNRARIAVCWIVNFEGFTDAANSYDIAYKDYSCKAGFWRLLDTFEENGVKGCWYTNGIIATRYPETLRELARLNHEIDGHNWANNIPMTSISAAAERELVRRVFSDVEKACGVRITGWMGSGEAESSNTFEYLADEGVLWNGDFPTDDVPYIVPCKGRKIVIIPYQREANDSRTIGGFRYHPRVWLDKFKDQFDVMYEEGATYPQYLCAATHSWLLGHPAGKKAVEEAIRYPKGFPGVWQTTENEVAKWWLKQNYT